MLEKQKTRFKKVLEQTEEIKNFYEKNVNEIKKVLDYFEKDISIKDSDSKDTIILKKYIECGSMKKVCEFMNEEGHRITTKYSERKYTTEDISQTIYPYKRNGEEDKEERVINATEELKEVALIIHWYLYYSSYGKLKVCRFDREI